MILPSWIAHRGARRLAPENTLAAFAVAKQLGFSWVEFDVLLSQDRIPIIMHDETVERTTNGNGLVKALNYAQLRHLKSIQFGVQTHIPSFAQTLDYLGAHKLHANIEIKSATHLDAPLELLTGEQLDLAWNRKNAELTCNELRRVIHPISGAKQEGNENTAYSSARPTTQVLISSFCMAALSRARQVLPTVPLGLLLYVQNWDKEWSYKCRVIAHYFQTLKCYSLHINDCQLTAERIALLKSITPIILVYTINDTKRAEQLFAWGVTAIFTDGPSFY